MKILLLLIILLANFGQTDNQQLILGKWTVKTVVNKDLNEFISEEINKGTTWNFKSDNSFIFEINNDLFNKIDSGQWNLTERELVILQSSDTIRLKIDKLTKTQLIWIMEKGNRLKFELEKVLE